MTDQTTLPATPAPPSPSPGTGNYTPEHAAFLVAERARYIAGGFDADEFDRICPPPAPFTGRGGQANRMDIGQRDTMDSPAMAKRMEAALLKAGVDPARIEAARVANTGNASEEAARMANALRRQGVAEGEIRAAMEADGTAPPAETRTPEQVEYDRSFGMDKVYRSADFKISWPPEVRIGGVEGMQAASASAGDFLAATGFAPGAGVGLVEHAIARGQSYAKATPSQQALWKTEQKAIGLRASGGDQARLDATIAAAGQTLRRAISTGSPAAVDFADNLSRSGAAHDWHVIKMLASLAEHRNRWEAGRPGKKS